MQGEILVFVVGLTALLIWSPALVVAVFVGRAVNASQRGQGVDESSAAARAVLASIAVLLAYTPLYLLLIFSLFWLDVFPSGGE
jgi:hypothetical protein